MCNRETQSVKVWVIILILMTLLIGAHSLPTMTSASFDAPLPVNSSMFLPPGDVCRADQAHIDAGRTSFTPLQYPGNLPETSDAFSHSAQRENVSANHISTSNHSTPRKFVGFTLKYTLKIFNDPVGRLGGWNFKGAPPSSICSVLTARADDHNIGNMIAVSITCPLMLGFVAVNQKVRKKKSCKMPFNLSNTDIDQFLEAAQFRLEVERELPQETILLLDHIADQIMTVRMRTGESRKTFAQNAGIQVDALVLAENGCCSPEILIDLIGKLDQAYQSDLGKVINLVALQQELYSQQ